MHLQENSTFGLEARSHEMWPSTLYITVYKKIHYLTFDLDLGVKFTQSVAQYPQHHVTYSATKFEVATPNDLGGDTFIRKYHI